MVRNYLLLSLFGILTFFAASTDAILGGVKAGVDQFRYQVSVMNHKNVNLCGGGIISELHVLTAANCVIDDENRFKKIPLHVLAGTNDLHGNSVRAVSILVKKTYVPRDYRYPPQSTNSDIAVLKLKDSFQLRTTHRYLQTLKIPTAIKETYAGITTTIAGYGFTWVKIEYGRKTGGTSDNQLRYANVEILRNVQCLPHMANHTEFYKKKICGRVKQVQPNGRAGGTCTGDRGSPLVIGDFVIGVLSTGPVSCSERPLSSIYTRVTEYQEFIENAMKGKTKDMITYREGWF